MTEEHKIVTEYLEKMNTPISRTLLTALKFIEDIVVRRGWGSAPSLDIAASRLRDTIVEEIHQSRLGASHNLPPYESTDLTNSQYSSLVAEADAMMKSTDGHTWNTSAIATCVHCRRLKAEHTGLLCPRWFQTYMRRFQEVLSARCVTQLKTILPQHTALPYPTNITWGALAILLVNPAQPELQERSEDRLQEYHAYTIWHESTARGLRADGIVWLRQPTATERAVLEACLRNHEISERVPKPKGVI